MKIKALILLWQRPKITEICFQGVKRLEKEGVEPICIYSDKDNKKLVKDYGFEGYYHVNKPLGNKLNYGLKKALETEWDYFTQIGSDDLVRNELFDIYKPYVEKKVKAFGLRQFYCYDINTGSVGYGESPYPYGTMRMIHREVLTESKYKYRIKFIQGCAGPYFHYGRGKEMDVDYQKALSYERDGLAKIIDKVKVSRPMWSPQRNRSLDFDSQFTLKTRGVEIKKVDVNEPMIMGIKSDVNIWGFDFFNKKKFDLLKYFPERDAIRELRQIYNNSAAVV